MQSLFIHINRLPARRAVQPRIINRRFRARGPFVVQYAPAEVVAARTRRHAFLHSSIISTEMREGGGRVGETHVARDTPVAPDPYSVVFGVEGQIEV